jgi:hypothetical protein
MPYDIRQWPNTVYPGEADSECFEAREVIDVLILELQRQGPQVAGYAVKNLGKRMGGLWQINLKFEKRQIRILFAPYRTTIVLFRIHKKSSAQEQKRAYELAQKRKSAYEQAQREQTNVGNRTLH